MGNDVQRQVVDYVAGILTAERRQVVEDAARRDEDLAGRICILQMLLGDWENLFFVRNEGTRSDVGSADERSGSLVDLKRSQILERVAALAGSWGAEALVDCPAHCRIVVNEVFVQLFAGRSLTRDDRLRYYKLAADTIEEFLEQHVTQFQEKVGTALLQGDTTVTITKANELRARQEGLRHLRAVNPRQGDVYALRLFAGREFVELADVFGAGEASHVEQDHEIATAEVHVVARAWAKSQGMIESLGL